MSRLVVRVCVAAGAMEKSLCLDNILGSVVVWAKGPRERFQTTSSHCRAWPIYQIVSSPAVRAGALTFSLNKNVGVSTRAPWLCGKWVLPSLALSLLCISSCIKSGVVLAFVGFYVWGCDLLWCIRWLVLSAILLLEW